MTNKERLIEIANRYYNGEPNVITDKEYDELEDLVRQEDPNFNVKDHITYKDELVNCRHLAKFVPLNKVKYNTGSNLTDKVKSKDAVLVPKYDGSSIRAYYENGKLTNIISRSNEIEGINQTKKLRNKVLNDVPTWVRFIDYELLVPMEDFGDNARSKANGLVNSKYLEDDVEKYAFPCPFYCNEYDGRSYRSRMEEILSQEPFGGKLPYEFDRSAIENFHIDRVMINGKTYPIDGIVVYDDFDNEPHLVNRIFKFYYIEDGTTTVDYIEWNRSDYGYYIPKVIINPVVISGKHIRRAAGGSVDTVIGKKICKGATVKVILAGLTIPQVSQVVDYPEVQDYTIPKCASCGHELGYTSTGYVCTNPMCTFWQANILKYFCINTYPKEVFHILNQGGFANLDAFFDKLNTSESLIEATKLAVESKITDGGIKIALVNCLSISRLSGGVRNNIVKNMVLTQDGLWNSIERSLSPRAKEEIRRKKEVYIEFISRFNEFLLNKCNIELLKR